jgi:hypothetical protein
MMATMIHPEHNTNGVNIIMTLFHTLPVELLDKILLNLSPGDIPSLLEAMNINMRFINRMSFLRSYCEMKLNYFFENSSLMHNTFDLLVRRYSSKKNFYCKLFKIITDAYCTPEEGYFLPSIKINSDWLNDSEHFYHIQDFIVEEMIKTFVYKIYSRNLPAVQWSHDWENFIWKTKIFPLTFSLLVNYPRIFQNLGEEGPKMILKCYTNGITFSMIQNRILALAASGEEQTFETIFSNDLFND